MNAPEQHTMQERLAQAIRDKHVTMKPKWRLLLPHVLVIAGIVFLAILLILHTSSLLYGLRTNGSLNLIFSGMGNLGLVLNAFPWIPAALLLALLLTLALIVSRSSRAWRLPILYSIIAIPVVIVGLSVLIENLPGHDQLQQFTTSSFPVVGPALQNVATTEPANTYIGQARNVQASSFTLINRKGEAIPVQVSATTKVSPTAPVQANSVVQVTGTEKQGTVDAKTVQKVPARFQEEVMERIDTVEKQKAKDAQAAAQRDLEKAKNANTNGNR